MSHDEYIERLDDATTRDIEAMTPVPWNEIQVMQEYIHEIEIERSAARFNTWFIGICCGVIGYVIGHFL